MAAIATVLETLDSGAHIVAGDDLYDDSFSVDSPSGDFLGECGVGISETIGVGDPKSLGLEVWLSTRTSDLRRS
jgi:hypothetical protein